MDSLDPVYIRIPYKMDGVSTEGLVVTTLAVNRL